MSSTPQVTAKEIATAIGQTVQWVRRLAALNDWAGTTVNKRGDRRYEIDRLPSDIQQAVITARVLESHTTAAVNLPVLAPPALPAVARSATVPAPSTLTDWQRGALDARCAILHLVDDLAAATNVSRAVSRVVRMAREGTLPAPIQKLVPVANARAAGDVKLSKRTIYRWLSLRTAGPSALAPKDQTPPVPEWAPYFLQLYRQPQKPSVADVLERLPAVMPEVVSMPSKMQCYRFLKKMSAVDREKGRMTGNELRSIKPYRQRSTDELMPLDVVTCDGHTFKARIAHPFHGKPFQPEVCACVDVATRKAIGWSAGLAESAATVADALRHAIQNAGIPAMFYTDPGSGNTAKVNAHESFGRYARLGITFTTGLPGRTQARGLIERFQKSCWIRAAKQLPTYVGKDMDGAVLYKMTRLIESEVRKTGSSDVVMPWRTFVDFLMVEAIDAYNHRPHSSLPKITDTTGRKRHMTPAECWDLWIHQGWQPERVSDEELADMWRPRVQCGTWRGQIRLFGNIYYHGDLQHYHGSQMIVEYEQQDAEFIYVRDLAGRLVCRAKWNANKSSYQPVSALEIARENRAKNRRTRAEQRLEEIELERRGTVVIDMQPDPALIAARSQVEEEMRLELAPPDEPEFPDTIKGRWQKWKWLDGIMKANGAVPPEHESFYRAWRTSHEWTAFSEMERVLGGNNAQQE